MLFLQRHLFWFVGGFVSAGLAVAAILFAATARAKAREKLTGLSTYTNTVNRLKDAAPYPTPEAIAKVNEDTAQVEQFSQEAEALFHAPKPPAISPRRFKVQLINSLVALQTEATNHNVRLPANFHFTFGHLLPLPNLLPYSVGPLGERLQDIQELTKILFASRVHAIDSLARVPAYAREPGGRVLLYDVGIRTNLSTETADFTSTPYRFSFRGFTTELTEVLNRLARADRFYVVRQIEVQATRSAEPVLLAHHRGLGGRLMSPPNDPGNLRRARANLLLRARAAQAASTLAASGQSPFETIVDEQPLRITMMIDVVKLEPKPAQTDR